MLDLARPGPLVLLALEGLADAAKRGQIMAKHIFKQRPPVAGALEAAGWGKSGGHLRLPSGLSSLHEETAVPCVSAAEGEEPPPPATNPVAAVMEVGGPRWSVGPCPSCADLPSV